MNATAKTKERKRETEEERRRYKCRWIFGGNGLSGRQGFDEERRDGRDWKLAWHSPPSSSTAGIERSIWIIVFIK